MPVSVNVWWCVPDVCALVGAISGGITLSRIEGAKERYEKRRAQYERAMKWCEGRYKHASSRFDQLGKTRLEAVVTLGKAVEFLERARIGNRGTLALLVSM